MAGISVKLPLLLDGELGPYKLNKTLKESIKQNFKNLILTNPGERIMDTNFGVGLITFLFESDTPAFRENIKARINEQTKMYMPFIKIKSVTFIGKSNNIITDKNSINIKIHYSISQLNVSDLLDISL
jgi:phage baseplate assembly protein W